MNKKLNMKKCDSIGKHKKDHKHTLSESLFEDATEAEIKVGMAAVVSSLIKDEYEAIDGYNSAIITAQSEGYDEVVKALIDIQAEENVHVGQLQELMKLFDPNASKVEEGQAEGREQLDSTEN